MGPSAQQHEVGCHLGGKQRQQLDVEALCDGELLSMNSSQCADWDPGKGDAMEEGTCMLRHLMRCQTLVDWLWMSIHLSLAICPIGEHSNCSAMVTTQKLALPSSSSFWVSGRVESEAWMVVEPVVMLVGPPGQRHLASLAGAHS